MSYQKDLKYRYKPVVHMEHGPVLRFKRNCRLTAAIRRMFSSPPHNHGQATRKAVVYYDYSPKPGLPPHSRAPFHSKWITGSIFIAGLAGVWSLNQASSAFYEPLEEISVIDALSVLDPARELENFVGATETFVERDAPWDGQQDSAAAETADDPETVLSNTPTLNPILPEDVLESFSYPSLPRIDLSVLPKLTIGQESALEGVQYLPDLAAPLASLEPDAEPVSPWLIVTLQSGDNLSILFDRYGLGQSELHQILELAPAKEIFRKLRTGQEIRIKRGADGSVEALNLEVDPTQELHISKTAGQGFSADIHARELESRIGSASGKISSSLFSDGLKAGLSQKLVLQLVAIFGWDIDFALDLQPGDRFAVLYEERYFKGEKVQNGTILAAEFINSGRIYRAVRYTDETGRSAYYSPNGESMEKAFLRTPVEVGKITSGFNLKRLHPILNRVRAHKGVDYGAPIGTPVFATGSGKVDFVGRKSGYGNTIVLQHGDKYSTLYAHLSKFEKGVKAGQRVHQGDLIGYVGKTGLATGPHLHYEFQVDGAHKDPLSVELPRAIGIEKVYKADFMKQTQSLVAQLNQLSNLAQAEAEADTVAAASDATAN